MPFWLKVAGQDLEVTPLAAPETLDFEAVAGILSNIPGRNIAHVVDDDEEWKATAVERGVPPLAAEFTLRMFRAARRDEASSPSQTRRWRPSSVATSRLPAPSSSR